MRPGWVSPKCASKLRSYSEPLIILAGVPLGASGAVIGHFLLGHDLSFISMFGMVALGGVVVNDSLVMIDRYNKIRSAPGIGPAEAIVEAVRHRFRAIFLTTATTALGLTPMLFETDTQAQFLIPMAVSLATGILFASVMSLTVKPPGGGVLDGVARSTGVGHEVVRRDNDVDYTPSILRYAVSETSGK